MSTVRHHEDTIAAYAAQVIDQPDTLALIVVGSVARGTARPTSDVDVYLVVTDDAFAAAQSAGRVAYIDTDAATYDSYVDIKLASPRYLERAVAHADDPTRASFLDARIVFDHTGSMAAAVARIVTLPDGVWQRRVHAYRCQARLYGGYFLEQAYERGDEFLLRHSAVHLGLSVGRAALAVNRILFQGQKYLAATLPQLADLPDGFLAAWRRDPDRSDTGHRSRPDRHRRRMAGRPAQPGGHLVDLHHRQRAQLAERDCPA